MPNFDRYANPSADDLDIATRVMDTVQKQIASYRQALVTVREMRRVLAETPQDEGEGGTELRRVNTPELLAELFEENGLPVQLSKAMAAEDFQDSTFETALAFWTWDCCCTDCCLTVPPPCTLTFVYPLTA